MKINIIVSVMVLIASLLSLDLIAQEKELPNIAISDLVGQGIEQSQAIVVTEQLRAELLKSGKLRIIERSQMQEILKEQGFQKAGCTSDECAVEIGQILGVKNIIVGTIGIAGSYTLLAVRVLDAATGAVTTSETVKTKGGIDNLLEKGIQDVAQKVLAEFLGEPAAVQPARKSEKSNKTLSKKAATPPEKQIKKSNETLGEEAVLQPEKQSKKSKGRKRALIFGGIGAVVVGGGVAAIILFNDTNKEPITLNNVEIDLPW